MWSNVFLILLLLNVKTQFCSSRLHTSVSLPLPNILADFQELHLLPEIIAITVPVFETLFPAKVLTSFCLAAASYSCQWHQEVILLDGAAHVEPFRADRSELLVLVV